ncbi:hypothetical protein [Streptomyces sp. H27-D2]|uniref:hypothetical protein n=1 Tax=Streptomyces sp. H27-D2 TaxID=3046304 RepID=UPI002DBD157E|nr:hypothetical protein [Streptomyces sp. H27-D2]MEC4018063.1 hypothetical protein [Streptomyces sp. H27-D2]
MGRMQRALVHAAAWTLATGAAVTLSWFGVHTVMAGTAYDPPRALPISDDAPSRTEPDGGAEPRVSSTHRSKPSLSATPSKSREPKNSGDSPGATGNTPKAPPGTAPQPPSSSVKTTTVAGGRVTFDLGRTSAGLVSATPNHGWQMQVWKQDQWIRVTFTGGAASVSVFCTWNGHEPVVEVHKD